MEAYTSFAAVYDIFMDNVPYEDWVDYLYELLKEYHITEGLLLDLGCGTGTVTELLADKGYDMIGVDSSQEMLNIATAKRDQSGNDILYLLQDMREFELYGTIKAAVSICDSINYIIDKHELIEVFRLVNNYLDKKGMFIFDFNTLYKYQEVMGNQTIAENRDDCSFIWDNYYYEDDQLNEYELTLFINEDAANNGLYRKYEEVHCQRAYEYQEMKALVAASGLEFIAAYDAFTREMPHSTSERIYVVTRENGKE